MRNDIFNSSFAVKAKTADDKDYITFSERCCQGFAKTVFVNGKGNFFQIKAEL